ncbi:MAG: Gfo/Idh/MocA family oxidoreductase [Planctomycetes bacterium]|nr:Gfo/Idh/MocA family oxidoreductase [Planctomycetota bacterium]
MAEHEPLGVGIVGCGRIAEHYATSLRTKPDKVRLVGGYDTVPERAKELMDKHGARVFESCDALLTEPEVQIVLNLTIQQVHAEVTAQALDAGKHVHSEKPLACTREDGLRLLQRAEEKGVRLSCAPFTFLGEAQQTFIKAQRDGCIGKPLVAYSEMNWGAVERRNPRPIPFYQKGAGPLLDVGVYPLTLLTAALGPVKRVMGFAQIVQPERIIASGPDAGTKFAVETPDQVVGGLEFECGTAGRITASFRSGQSKQANGTEFHGEGGSLFVASNTGFNAAVEQYDLAAEKWNPVPYVKEPFSGIEWGRAVFDLIDSLRSGAPQRCTGQQAYHVLEICLGILESAEAGQPVDVSSRFTRPEPMPWAS